LEKRERPERFGELGKNKWSSWRSSQRQKKKNIYSGGRKNGQGKTPSWKEMTEEKADMGGRGFIIRGQEGKRAEQGKESKKGPSD